MPKGNAPRKARQRAILEIMNRGITSPTEIVGLLSQEYGIKTTRQTVYRDIANGVEPVTEEILEDYKASMIENIDELGRVAYDQGLRGDVKAMNAYNQLMKTKAEILKKIVEIQADLESKERPIYTVKIGKFDEAVKKEKKKDDRN